MASSKFAESLVSIAIAQLINNIGIDRIHKSAHHVLVGVLEEFMTSLARKVIQQSANCGRSNCCILDTTMPMEYFEITGRSLIKYLENVTLTRSDAFGFPRLKPGAFPLSA